MNIYPKTCRNLVGMENLMPYVNKNKGVELQFFNENGILERFQIEDAIDNVVRKVPDIKEITIHPPLHHYEIESIIAKDINILKEQFELLVALSKKYKIKLNIVYHTLICFEVHKVLTVDKLKEMLKILEGADVRVVLENIYMFPEKKCTVYELADYIDHPNLKVCFDICHLHCRANINKQSVEEYAKDYLDKELCKKYTYQVHFSYTANNDGYIDHKTHGIRHPNTKALRKDYELLKEYNMTDCNYITEISEEDYSTRIDQIKELDMLNEVIR